MWVDDTEKAKHSSIHENQIEDMSLIKKHFVALIGIDKITLQLFKLAVLKKEHSFYEIVCFEIKIIARVRV